MAIKVDDSVQLPPRRRGSGKTQMDELCEAVKTMQIGQSFYCPNSNSASYVIVAAQKLLDRAFVRRSEGKGCRVWRIA